MAVVSGVGGSVSGATYVANVTEWSVTLNTESIDTTKLNATNSYRTKIAGIKSWSGSYTCLVDGTDIANIDADAGAVTSNAVFNLSGGGNLTGNIVVTDIAVTASLENAVEAVYTFEGSGELAFANS